MKKNMNQKKSEKFILCILFLASFLSVAWSLSKFNLPVFDDYILLNQAKFSKFSNFLHFLPSASYNDRPLRMILLKTLDELCGQNFQSYHIVLIFIHLINVYLAYKVCEQLFAVKTNNKLYAIIAAAFLGIYPYSHMTVVWIANTPDLQCCTFILLTLLLYLKYLKFIEKKQLSILYGCGSIISFYLALRCKEMALTLPVIILMYEIYRGINEHKRPKLNFYIIGQFTIMAVFLAILFMDKGTSLNSVDSVYYQSFSIKDLALNAIKYLFLFFDWGNSAFYFNNFTLTALPGVILFVIIFIYGVYTIVKKKDFALVFAIIQIGISLGIVLPLINSVHRTYLYIPSFFVGIVFAVFMMKLNIKKVNIKGISVIVVIALYLLTFTNGNRILKEYWFNYCKNEDYQMSQIEKLEKPKDNTHIYIKGASGDYNIFTYGPGESIKYAFDNNTYHIELVEEFPTTSEGKSLFILYENGKINEVTRE